MAIVVTTDFPPSFGGIQTYMERVASEWSERGIEVTVIAPNAPGAKAFDEKRSYRVVRSFAFGRGLIRKVVTPIGLAASYVRVLARADDRRTLASAWWPAGLAVAVVSRLVRARVVTAAHGMEIAPSRGGVRRALARWTYSRSRRVAANSRFTAALLAEIGIARNVVVVNCGVDVRDVVRAPAKVPTVVSMGRLVERKGFDVLLEAVARLSNEVSIRCAIVGDGPQRASLVALSRKLDVADRVDFVGSIDDDAVSLLLAQATCFALPVRRIGDDVEGFGIVYLEAAIAGLPAIGGRDSGAADAIADGETGVLVDGESIDAVTSALRAMLSDDVRSGAMGRAARARALSSFTWASTASALERAFE